MTMPSTPSSLAPAHSPAGVATNNGAIPVTQGPAASGIRRRRWWPVLFIGTGCVLGALVAAAAVGRVGATGWARETESIERDLIAASTARANGGFDLTAAGSLPEPVRRYFQLALHEAQRPIHVARFTQVGQLRTGVESPSWLSFTARQTIVPLSPGFVWDARIGLAPLVHASLRDAYVDGNAHARVALQSAITVAEEHDSPALNTGDMYRLLAEGPWCPTALLPRKGLSWAAGDRDDRAVATLTVHETSVSVEFRFNDAGEVTGIFAAGRPRKYGTTYVDTPWEGHFGHYVSIDGIRVPTTGEVGWWIEGRWLPVWKATLADFAFEFEG
jgi:hypothetical protein